MGKSTRNAARVRPIRLRRIRTVPKPPSRRRDAHKGSFGRVLVIGGSRGMIGAPALVANAALRSGAGLVTVACPRSIQLQVATLCPCATTLPLAEDGQGRIDPREVEGQLRELGLLDESDAPTVAAIGPGLGRGDASFDAGLTALCHAFGDDARVPVVLDADALNAMHRGSGPGGGDAAAMRTGAGWDRALHFRTIITPHPGELGRMHGVSAGEVQADREGFAVRTAREMSGGEDHPDYRAVVVLKGAGTIVTDGHSLFVNRTGNAGMATGGSGDVLTGVISGLLAQGMSGLEAAMLGVQVHGRAGDLAARRLGQLSLVATDLIEFLPFAFGGAGARRR